jgi:hypothetical protein
VVCKWTDSLTMDCPDVCLVAFWLQEWEWVLEDCHKRSCWKNSIGASVLRPYRSDVYVCLKSCCLCLTVVYWLLECNKVPSWIEPPNTLQYLEFITWAKKSRFFYLYLEFITWAKKSRFQVQSLKATCHVLVIPTYLTVMRHEHILRFPLHVFVD